MYFSPWTSICHTVVIKKKKVWIRLCRENLSHLSSSSSVNRKKKLLQIIVGLQYILGSCNYCCSMNLLFSPFQFHGNRRRQRSDISKFSPVGIDINVRKKSGCLGGGGRDRKQKKDKDEIATRSTIFFWYTGICKTETWTVGLVIYIYCKRCCLL